MPSSKRDTHSNRPDASTERASLRSGVPVRTALQALGVLWLCRSFEIEVKQNVKPFPWLTDEDFDAFVNGERLHGGSSRQEVHGRLT